MNQRHQMLHRILGMQTKVILDILYEEFEDTKGLIRICISKKNRQRSGQKKINKRTNNYLQNIHIKPKIE
jgi:hypothetical protein